MNTESPTSTRRRPKLQHLLAYLFVPVVFYFWWQSIRRLNLADSLAQTQGREGWLLITLLFAGFYLLGQAVVWRQIVVDLVVKVEWLPALRAWMVSNMGRYLPGSVWHLVGRVLIGQGAGVQKTSGALGVVLEQALQLLSALLIVGLSLPFWSADSIVGQYAWIAWLVPLGFVGIHPRLFFPILNVLLTKIGRPPLAATLSYSMMVRYTFYYMLVHLCNGLALATAVVALGQPLNTVPVVVGAAMFAWTVGYLIIVAPGGLGVREWLVTEALAPVMGRDVAAVAALLWRAANIITEAIGAALFGLLIHPSVSTEQAVTE